MCMLVYRWRNAESTCRITSCKAAIQRSSAWVLPTRHGMPRGESLWCQCGHHQSDPVTSPAVKSCFCETTSWASLPQLHDCFAVTTALETVVQRVTAAVMKHAENGDADVATVSPLAAGDPRNAFLDFVCANTTPKRTEDFPCLETSTDVSADSIRSGQTLLLSPRTTSLGRITPPPRCSPRSGLPFFRGRVGSDTSCSTHDRTTEILMSLRSKRSIRDEGEVVCDRSDCELDSDEAGGVSDDEGGCPYNHDDVDCDDDIERGTVCPVNFVGGCAWVYSCLALQVIHWHVWRCLQLGAAVACHPNSAQACWNS
jgi:hypothetical protein